MTHRLVILDQTGHTEVDYKVDVAVQVAAAQAQFEQLVRQGYAAYSVTKGGQKDTFLTEFDPTADTIIMTPRIVGG